MALRNVHFCNCQTPSIQVDAAKRHEAVLIREQGQQQSTATRPLPDSVQCSWALAHAGSTAAPTLDANLSAAR